MGIWIKPGRSTPQPTCPVCGSTDTRPLCAVSGYEIHRCVESATEFVWPMPNADALKDMYDRPGFFEGGEVGGYQSYDAQVAHSLPTVMKLLARFPNGGNGLSILDVGCGYGTNLRLAAERQWKCFGIEVSAHARRIAADRHGNRLTIVERADDLLPHCFDLILMLDVIDHLPNPFPLFFSLFNKGAIGPETLVVIATPNARSLEAVANPSGWAYRHPPFHLVYYSAKSLQLLLQRLRFNEIRIAGAQPLPSQVVTPYEDEAPSLNDDLRGWGGIICECRSSDFAAFMQERYVPGTWSGLTAYEHLPRYAFARILAKGIRVLDFGCGTGYGAASLAEVAESVVGVDINAGAIEWSGRTHRRPNLRFEQRSDLGRGFAPGSFDLVTCFEVIEQVNYEMQPGVVRSMRDLLTPTGKLVISTPNPQATAHYGNNPYHLREMTAAQFMELLQPFFKRIVLFGQWVRPGVLIGPHSLGDGKTTSMSALAGNFGVGIPLAFIALCSQEPFEPPAPLCQFDTSIDLVLQTVEAERLLDRLRFENYSQREQLTTLNNLTASTKAELARVIAENASLKECIAAQSRQIEKTEEVLRKLKAEGSDLRGQNDAFREAAATLKARLQLRDDFLRQQTWAKHKIEAELAVLRNSRMLRLGQAIRDGPLSVKKLARITYLLGAICLPPAAKPRIKSLVTWMRSRLGGPGPAIARPTPYAAQLAAQTKPDRPRILHALANFCIGGSSRLVVDLIERLSDSYEQEVLTSFIPTPPAYVGIKVSEIKQEGAVDDFVEQLCAFGPILVHVHYWGDSDYRWYEKVIQAAELYGCSIIENINTPVTPYSSEAVNRYVYVSNYVRDHFGRHDANSMVVHPGSNFRLFSRSAAAPIAQDCIGMVYRLERDKLDEHSIDPFIAVAQRRLSTKVLIIGGGTLLEPFQAAVRRAGVEDRFQFTGYVPYDELPQLYSRMAVIVAPVWQESFGQVTPFAMHMGIPVAGYDIGALSEILGDKELLAPAGDSDALANIIVRLLDEPQKRLSIGRANRRRAAAQFSVETMVDKYRSLYAEVIGGGDLSSKQNAASSTPSSAGTDVEAQAGVGDRPLGRKGGLKVALFVHCFFPKHFYGTETHTLQVADNLRRMGHEPVVVSAVFQGEPRQDQLVTQYVYDGIPVYCIDRNFAPHSRIKETYYHEPLRAVLRNLLQEIRPDLVHVTHLINHTAVLLEVADDLGLPMVATMTDFFGFCFNNRLQAVDGSQCHGPDAGRTNCIACSLKASSRGGLGRLAAEWPQLTALGLSAMSCLPMLRTHRLAELAQDLKVRPDILASCYAKYRAAIMPSRFLREAYVANGLQTRCFDIPFGVDMPRDPKPARTSGQPLAFGFVGQIAPHKGTDLLVDAFTRLPRGAATLRIYGQADQDPGFMAKLRRTARGFAVRFEGTFPSQRMAEVLRDLDVLVIPSRWSENSPLVLLNALATHTPVIVSDTAGLTEFVEDGRNGFRFALGSAEALGQVMLRFVKEPQLAEQLSRTTEYLRTTRAMIEDVLDVYAFARG